MSLCRDPISDGHFYLVGNRTSENGPLFAMGRNAREADRRIGERMVADEAGWLGKKAQELLAAYGEKLADR